MAGNARLEDNDVITVLGTALLCESTNQETGRNMKALQMLNRTLLKILNSQSLATVTTVCR